MTLEPVKIVPKAGVHLSLDAFREVDLESGDRTLLSDVENRDNLLFADDAPLKPYLARFVRIEDNHILFEAKSHDKKRTELLCRSVPLEFKRGVPDAIKIGLENAYADLRAKANQPGVTEEAKEFISSLRLADPQESPDLYRTVKHNGEHHLFVIWGVTRHDGSAMYPLDAIQRIPSHANRKSWLAALAAIAALALLGLLAFLFWPSLSSSPKKEPISVVDTPTENNSIDEPKEEVLPKTDSDVPPFLVVRPQAVVIGQPINIIPRNVGILTVSSRSGQQFLRREAKGVQDGEVLHLFKPALRKIQFVPKNEDFKTEALGLIIYAAPKVIDKTAQISIPDGINLDGATLDWGDGEIDSLSKSSPRKISHSYKSVGTYQARIEFPDNRNWASTDFAFEVTK